SLPWWDHLLMIRGLFYAITKETALDDLCCRLPARRRQLVERERCRNRRTDESLLSKPPPRTSKRRSFASSEAPAHQKSTSRLASSLLLGLLRHAGRAEVNSRAIIFRQSLDGQ